MLKSLYPQIDWEKIKIVGFDMDGTLYDELEFIVQVYRPIAKRLGDVCSANAEGIYQWMVERWLEKGSSYNKIFGEVLEQNNVNTGVKETEIANCLDIFRNFTPNLVLSARTRALLDFFHKNFRLFLITDGSSRLQWAKFNSLNLCKWFLSGNIAISGAYGSDYNKPSTKMTTGIEILKTIHDPSEVVFFGDRIIDREFAINAGFQFAYVKCMYDMES